MRRTQDGRRRDALQKRTELECRVGGGGALTTSATLVTDSDIRAFIAEYFEAWRGTDEGRILSYYSDNVSLEIPGAVINGKAALRDQFVRPFIAVFLETVTS